MSTAAAFDPLVDLIVERVLGQLRAELAALAPAPTVERLVRADATGLGKSPRASARAVRRLASAGRLPAAQIGRHLFVRPADLAAFVEAGRVTPSIAPIAPANDCAIDGVAALADELGLVPVVRRRGAAPRLARG